MMDHHRWPLMAEAGADGADAGGAGTEGQADAEGAGTADGLPTAAQWAETQKILAGLQADKETATAATAATAEAAEAARVAALSAAEQQAEQQAAMQADIEKQQGELRADRRDIALDKLKVLPNYRAYVPDVDPRTSEGAQQLEAWAKDHPEALAQAATIAPDYVPRAQSKLADIAAGKIKNPLVPIASLRRIMGGS
jgi:pyruvate/2-oxoglutarate dehydrogenase complex dihydrolipoamide acyltransferase (E2) component